MTKRPGFIACLIVLFATCACSGGGGGGGRGQRNAAPFASAGADRTVAEGATVTISGIGGDSDGSVVSYSWTQTSGPALTLTGATTATVQFVSPAVTSDTLVTLRLTVTDDDGASGSDTITITISDRVEIGELTFADANLAQCVAGAGATYVDELTELDCTARGISDATGIGQLPDLEVLDLSGNALTGIDLSANQALAIVGLSQNLLATLDVSANVSLLGLYVYDNQLTTIDLSANGALRQLDLGLNRLTTVDLRNSPLLELLWLDSNELASIDLSSNRLLEWLFLSFNDLATIDLSALSALTAVEIAGNLLTSVDFSNNPALSVVDVRSNLLTGIDVSANLGLTTLDVAGNDAIPCADIEAIEAQFPDLLLVHSVPNCGTGSWEPGVFAPAAQFEARCVSPRTGTDPATGLPYPDIPGTRLDENNWLRSWSNDLYLWYAEIEDRNPADFDTPEYFDLMKTFATTPSGTPKDQFHFSLDTAEYWALSQSGVSAGYGAAFAILEPHPPREVIVAYTEPDAPATTAPANLARGAAILEIDGVDVVNGSDPDAINAGLFPAAPGESHSFVVQDLGSATTRAFTMVSAEVTSVPVQGVTTIDTGTGRVGYMVFNDHIATAERLLIDAVEALAAANVTDLVLDIRYNGGGFLAIASEIAYMIAGPASTEGMTFEEFQFNDKHTDFDPVTGHPLTPVPFVDAALGFSAQEGTPLPSLDLGRVFVLTGTSTCSASESIMNSLRGIDVEVIQIGSTTCGKPYGFYPSDNCGTTYFSIQFRNINAKGFGEYADGFAPANTLSGAGTLVPGCSVADDYMHALGDPAESRLAAALGYRADGTCPAPSGLAPRALSAPLYDRDRSDGLIRKPVWLQNRLLERLPR